MEGGRGRRNNSISALAWTTTGGASFRPPPAPKKGHSVRQKSSHTHAIQKASPHSRDKQKVFCRNTPPAAGRGHTADKELYLSSEWGGGFQNHMSSNPHSGCCCWVGAVSPSRQTPLGFTPMLIWDWGQGTFRNKHKNPFHSEAYLGFGPWLQDMDIGRGSETWTSASSHWKLGIIMLKIAHLRLGPWHLYEGTQKSLSLRCSSGIKAPILIWDWGRRTFTRVPKNSNSL